MDLVAHCVHTSVRFVFSARPSRHTWMGHKQRSNNVERHEQRSLTTSFYDIVLICFKPNFDQSSTTVAGSVDVEQFSFIISRTPALSRTKLLRLSSVLSVWCRKLWK